MVTSPKLKPVAPRGNSIFQEPTSNPRDTLNKYLDKISSLLKYEGEKLSDVIDLSEERKSSILLKIRNLLNTNPSPRVEGETILGINKSVLYHPVTLVAITAVIGTTITLYMTR